MNNICEIKNKIRKLEEQNLEKTSENEINEIKISTMKKKKEILDKLYLLLEGILIGLFTGGTIGCSNYAILSVLVTIDGVSLISIKYNLSNINSKIESLQNEIELNNIMINYNKKEIEKSEELLLTKGIDLNTLEIDTKKAVEFNTQVVENENVEEYNTPVIYNEGVNYDFETENKHESINNHIKKRSLTMDNSIERR